MDKLTIIRKNILVSMEKENELLLTELNSAVHFINAIKSGDLSVKYNGLNNDRELALSLLSLQEKMINLKTQEEQRNWINEGIAKFAEMLRINQQQGIETLFNHLISEMVIYSNANQGGIFIHKNETQALELVACYAYGKRKFMSKTVEQGEGLVGQCFLEKDVIYMTDVPDDYVKITSGLGEALPRSILLVPILHDQTAVGVLELASFSKFETFQIDFIKKVAESMATVIINIRVNEQTKSLLNESQLQAEALKAQEEEMRQNMEELTASQEELRRVQLETETQNKIFNSMAIVSKTDLQGNITYVNDEFLKWSKYSREELMGKNHRMLKSGLQDDAIFKNLWDTISSGQLWRGEVKNRAKDGSYYWVDALIAPILGSNGKPREYISQRFVINEKKEREEQIRLVLEETQAKEEELRQNIEEMTAQQEELHRINLEVMAQTRIIDSTAIVSKADLRGNITFVNDQFLKWSKYSREELIGKNHRMLKSGHQPDEVFTQMWSDISSGKIWRGEVKNKAKDGSHYWVDAIIAPVLDSNGKPKEYIAQRFVINDKKDKEEKMKTILEDSQAKEEELRQNMEEMQAQQEELQRVTLEIEAQMKIINSIAIVSKADVRGNITYVNDEFLKWSKYTREELLGKNHRILKSGHQPDKIFVDMWKTISTGKIWRGTVKNKAKDGSYYWVDAIIAPVLDSYGKPKEYIAQRFVLDENDQRSKKAQSGHA